jgi:hypothetical protein
MNQQSPNHKNMKKRILSDSEDNNSDIEDMDEEESLMDADANFFGYQNKH